MEMQRSISADLNEWLATVRPIKFTHGEARKGIESLRGTDLTETERSALSIALRDRVASGWLSRPDTEKSKQNYYEALRWPEQAAQPPVPSASTVALAAPQPKKKGEKYQAGLIVLGRVLEALWVNLSGPEDEFAPSKMFTPVGSSQLAASWERLIYEAHVEPELLRMVPQQFLEDAANSRLFYFHNVYGQVVSTRTETVFVSYATYLSLIGARGRWLELASAIMSGAAKLRKLNQASGQ